MKKIICFLILITTFEIELAAAAPLPQDEMVRMLETIDKRMRSPGDYSALVYLEQKTPQQPDRVYQLVIYRRDADSSLIMLFTKPKTEAGKGYLRLSSNLWYYDPAVGKWDRRTERDRVAGTEARRRDFDDWELAQDYKPSYLGSEKLGAFNAHKLKLEAKPNVEVAYPILTLWVDSATGNPLKIESQALSGKVALTSFYPKWSVTKNAKGETVYYPAETRIFDELEKGKQTLILVQKADLTPLEPGVFTKAWLERQVR